MGVRCLCCQAAASMEEAIFAQLLMICHQNLLPESSFGCNYSKSSHSSVVAVLDSLQSGDSFWIKEEIGQLSACKTQNHHLRLAEACGEAISCTGIAAVEKPEACTRCAAFFQVPVMTFITIFTVQQCWVEKAHGCILPPLLSFQISVWKQLWNNFLQVMRYPFLPCCFSGTLHLGLCITLHYSTERHLFQQPVWIMHSQAFYRRIAKVWCCEFVCWNVCGLIPAVSTGQSQFSLPTYPVPVLRPAGTDPLCTSTGNIFSWLDPSASLHSASHQHVSFTLSHMLGLTSLSPHKSLIHELLASLPTHFCVHLSRKCMKLMHLEEHCKQVKLYIPSEKS